MIVRLSLDVSAPLTSLGYLTEWENNKDMKKSESRNLAPEAPIKPKTGKNAPHQ